MRFYFQPTEEKATTTGTPSDEVVIDMAGEKEQESKIKKKIKGKTSNGG